MADKKLTSFVVSVTPFDEEGRIDEAGLRAHLRRLGAASVGVYLAGGGSSEAYTMSLEEVRRVLQIGMEELKGKVPVRCMGMEPRTSQGMIDLAKVVQSVGMDTMQVYSLDVGHAKAPTETEMETYFRDILSATKVGAVLSSNRSVGYYIPLPLIKRLANDYPHFLGVNCSNDNLAYLAEMIQLVGNKIEIFVGGPEQALACFAFGGNGYLTTEGNLVPKLSASILKHYQAGDMEQCFAAWSRIVRLKIGINKYGGVRATKAALGMFGLPGGYPRKPRLPLDAAAKEGLAKVLEELEIRKVEGIP